MTPWSLIYTLLGRIHGLTFDNFSNCTRVHAGCGEYNKKRFIVIGDKGVGKTTLMTRLLFEGFRSDGDELVIIHDGETIPFPRRFHIKESSIELLPQIRPYISATPYINNGSGMKIFSFAPSETGFDWKIESRKTDFIFFLKQNHGSRTWVEKCPKYLMVQKMIPLSFFSISDDFKKIAALCQITDQADCFVLHIGSPDSAVSVMQETII